MAITQTQLARAMGVPRKQVHALCRNRRSITADTALMWGKVFGNSAEFWLNRQRRMDCGKHSTRPVAANALSAPGHSEKSPETQPPLDHPKFTTPLGESLSHRVCNGGTVFFHNKDVISTLKSRGTPLLSARSRVCFKSTEERSSRRREQTRSYRENRQRNSGSVWETGRCRMEPRKLLQPGCDNGRGWEARVHARSLGDSGVIIGCDLEAEPGLQKIGKEGAKSRKGNRPFALLDTISG
ncbi:MAG: HigA family addiction module antitoxin [Silvibacterium sp.]